MMSRQKSYTQTVTKRRSRQPRDARAAKLARRSNAPQQPAPAPQERKARATGDALLDQAFAC